MTRHFVTGCYDRIMFAPGGDLIGSVVEKALEYLEEESLKAAGAGAKLMTAFKAGGAAVSFQETYNDLISQGYSPAAAFLKAAASTAGGSAGAAVGEALGGPLLAATGAIAGSSALGAVADATIDGVSQRLLWLGQADSGAAIYADTKGQLYTQDVTITSAGYDASVGPMVPVSQATDKSGVTYASATTLPVNNGDGTQSATITFVGPPGQDTQSAAGQYLTAIIQGW